MIPLRDSVPARRPPVVMLGILGTCLVVFLYELGLPEDQLARLFGTFGVVPARLVGPDPPYFTLVTSMFLHGGWFHLLGNLLYLWIFGNNVEDAMGHGRFAVFYLLCGMAAGAVQVAFQPTSPVPMVGASGAIAGVLGAYLVLFPHARILALVPMGWFTQLAEVPAVLFLPLWFLLQLLYGLASLGVPTHVGGVAFWAHVGGFVAGVVLVRGFVPRRRR